MEIEDDDGSGEPVRGAASDRGDGLVRAGVDGSQGRAGAEME